MKRDVEQKIIDHLTLGIMNDPNFACNPHIRVRCAWIEAKKVFDELSQKQKNDILYSINKNCPNFHLPDFWD